MTFTNSNVRQGRVRGDRGGRRVGTFHREDRFSDRSVNSRDVEWTNEWLWINTDKCEWNDWMNEWDEWMEWMNMNVNGMNELLSWMVQLRSYLRVTVALNFFNDHRCLFVRLFRYYFHLLSYIFFHIVFEWRSFIETNYRRTDIDFYWTYSRRRGDRQWRGVRGDEQGEDIVHHCFCRSLSFIFKIVLIVVVITTTLLVNVIAVKLL